LKVFICADIHGNIRALDAVLDIYRRFKPCEFLFLGDCIGYGPHPDLCLDRLAGIEGGRLVMGNHEMALLDMLERRNLNALAVEALCWSEDLLRGNYENVIRSRFDMVVENGSFVAAHSSPVDSGGWPYIRTSADAEWVFGAAEFDVCFVGHTHVQSIHGLAGGEISAGDGISVELDPGDRYIINPGSVGQPRDGDPRAACCVFERKTGTIEFFRCVYDVESEVDEFRKAGLPLYLGERLLYGV